MGQLQDTDKGDSESLYENISCQLSRQQVLF